MSIYKDVRAALEGRLATTPGIPAIAWQNVDYNPTTGTPFVKAQFQPTSRAPAHKGNNPQRLYQGLFTMLVHYPENQGPGASQTLVDTLVNRFDDTVVIDYTGASNVIVQIEYCTPQSPYNSEPWFVTPIRVGWFVYF